MAFLNRVALDKATKFPSGVLINRVKYIPDSQMLVGTNEPSQQSWSPELGCKQAGAAGASRRRIRASQLAALKLHVSDAVTLADRVRFDTISNESTCLGLWRILKRVRTLFETRTRRGHSLQEFRPYPGLSLQPGARGALLLLISGLTGESKSPQGSDAAASGECESSHSRCYLRSLAVSREHSGAPTCALYIRPQTC